MRPGTVTTLALCACLAACATTKEAPPAPTPAAAAPDASDHGATCAGWHTLDESQHTVIIGSILETEVGAPEASMHAACLWAISDQIAEHLGKLCDAGRPYGEASKLAFTSADEFCTEKTR